MYIILDYPWIQMSDKNAVHPLRVQSIHSIMPHTHTHMSLANPLRYLGCGPLPATVTTRIATNSVGDPYKPSFATVTERGPHPLKTSISNGCTQPTLPGPSRVARAVTLKRVKREMLNFLLPSDRVLKSAYSVYSHSEIMVSRMSGNLESIKFFEAKNTQKKNKTPIVTGQESLFARFFRTLPYLPQMIRWTRCAWGNWRPPHCASTLISNETIIQHENQPPSEMTGKWKSDSWIPIDWH